MTEARRLDFASAGATRRVLPDLEPEVSDEMLVAEHRDWMEGSINVQDVMGSDCNPKFTLTQV